MQRRGDDDRVDVFAVKQAAGIVVGLDRGDYCLHLLVPQREGVSDGDTLDPGLRQRVLQYLLAAVARADQANANAIVGAERPGGEGGVRRRARSDAKELTSIDPGEFFLLHVSAPAFCRSAFMPAQLCREDSSGVLLLVPCVANETPSV